jgi:hypothetical protein
MSGRDRALSIATRYGLESPGINPRGGKVFRVVQSVLDGHPPSCTWVLGFPRRQKRSADHPLPSSAGLRMGWSYTTSSVHTLACRAATFAFKISPSYQFLNFKIQTFLWIAIL